MLCDVRRAYFLTVGSVTQSHSHLSLLTLDTTLYNIFAAHQGVTVSSLSSPLIALISNNNCQLSIVIMGNCHVVINCNAVISDMQAHPSDARVQRNGCEALWKLAINSNNQVTIAAAGGIKAVIHAMLAHPSDAKVQENGCFALRNLADNSNNQVTIVAAGGIKAVISAMQVHPSDTGVQSHGCWTLRNLTANSNNQVTIAAAGGINAVISAMQAHPSDDKVQLYGCWALRNLAANSNNKVTIVAASGIVAVTSATCSCFSPIPHFESWQVKHFRFWQPILTTK